MARDRPIAMPVRIIIASLGGEGSRISHIIMSNRTEIVYPTGDQ